MFSFLKNHPFAVEAFFESSFVLTFAFPKEELLDLIPECLSLDTFEDTWGFVAIAMVQTKNLRPKGFPKIFGNDFFLIGYRIFVRYETVSGRKLRGLYILKSETNRKKMEFLGNRFTHYNYSTTDINQKKEGIRIETQSNRSNFKIVLETPDEDVLLPQNSPFADWKEARKFAGPLPFTFTYDSQKKIVLIIEGVRQNWKPQPVCVVEAKIPFLDSLNLKNKTLANAFIIQNIPYSWKKGRTELWTR
ncbi:DUF2071 domain-containing protein [Leptospira sp. WS92.C1]